MPLSLVSLNIEREKHFERILPFLKERGADIVCFQELLERDIPRIIDALGGTIAFAPELRYGDLEGEPVEGVALWTRAPIETRSVEYGTITKKGELGTYYERMWNKEEMYAVRKLILLSGDVQKDGVSYRVATTHFTWTPQGTSTPIQLADLDTLLVELDALGEFAFCGDLNAARGYETFTHLAERYHDAIPQEYATSIDVELHRAGKANAAELSTKMVDGLFTSPGYEASDVRLQFGLSDHAAIVATIEKAAR